MEVNIPFGRQIGAFLVLSVALVVLAVATIARTAAALLRTLVRRRGLSEQFSRRSRRARLHVVPGE
jgi:hypothetical protein